MKLIRLATLYFEPIPKTWRHWSFTFNNVKIESMGNWELEDGKRLRLMVFAEVNLPSNPRLTSDGVILIPDHERREAEEAIEVISNLIAVSEMCKRSISSPIPCISFIPDGQTR